MTKVKLEEIKDKRRLHIGSYFVDLNESEYQELVRIFSDQSRKADVIKSVCPDCKGTGDLSGKSQNIYEQCPQCDGSGQTVL